MADFKLGRLKFKWRGDWATSTGYVIDDIVKYGGNSYVFISNHTSPNNENILNLSRPNLKSAICFPNYSFLYCTLVSSCC